MDATVQTALVAGLSAIGGGAITALAQWFTAKSNHSFLLRQDIATRKAAAERESLAAFQLQTITAHKILSRIAREFSITTLDIVWNSQITDAEYDKRYVANCELTDELRAIVDLSVPSLSESVDNIYGQMNLFWGYFRQLLRLSRAGATYEAKQETLSKVQEAARELGTYAIHAKERLGRLAHVGERDG